MHLQENTLFDFAIGIKVTQNIGQYHLHHVTFASAKFEVAMPTSLGDAFTEKYITVNPLYNDDVCSKLSLTLK